MARELAYRADDGSVYFAIDNSRRMGGSRDSTRVR